MSRPMRVSKISEHYCGTFNPFAQSSRIARELSALMQREQRGARLSNEEFRKLGSWQKYRKEDDGGTPMSAEEIRAAWGRTGRKAAAEGTVFHRVAEWLMLRGDARLTTAPEALLQEAWAATRRKSDAVAWRRGVLAGELEQLVRVFVGMRRQGWLPVHSELKVEGYGIAGTIDAVWRHARTGVVRIIDWKRSKGDTYPVRERCRAPFAAYRATKGTQWSVQTNLYGLLYRRGAPGTEVELVTMRFFGKEDPDTHVVHRMGDALLIEAIRMYQCRSC